MLAIKSVDLGRGALLGAALALLGALFAATGFGARAAEWFDLWCLFHARGERAAPQSVAVVSIDVESADQLGLARRPGEWPRSIHAELVRKLGQAGATLIAFDLFFGKSKPEHDATLAQALRAAGNVVLVERLEPETEVRVLPTESLRAAAAATAPFMLPRQPVRVARFWAYTGAEGVPTVPVVALHGAHRDAADRLPARAASNTSGSAGSNALEEIARSRRTLSQDKNAARALSERLGANDAAARALLHAYAMPPLALLNFYGPPRTVPTIPYYRVIQGLESDDLRGKVVFVGFSPLSAVDYETERDDYDTVFSEQSGLRLSGVEIAATAYANLLERSTLREPTAGARVALAVVWGLAIGLLALALPVAHASPAVLALSIAYAAVALAAFSITYLWLPLLVPLAQALLAFVTAIAVRYRLVARERQRIREAFGRFLPPDVVDNLAQDVSRIGADHQLVYGICLATDAQDYTTLSERLTPERLTELVKNYLAALFPPVKTHGGIISDIVGDAMLALWVGPRGEVDLRARACDGALAVARAAEEFNAGNQLKLPTRIGVHAGPVMLGTIGHGDHFEFRAIGDIVNTANRVQGLSKYLGTQRLVSEEVVQGLEQFLLRPVGTFVLAGKSNALKLYELLGRRDQASADAIWLCEAFAAVLQQFETRQWAAASAGLRAILARFPDDGPARIYLDKCTQLLAAPPAQWSPALRVHSQTAFVSQWTEPRLS